MPDPAEDQTEEQTTSELSMVLVAEPETAQVEMGPDHTAAVVVMEKNAIRIAVSGELDSLERFRDLLVFLYQITGQEPDEPEGERADGNDH